MKCCDKRSDCIQSWKQENRLFLVISQNTDMKQATLMSFFLLPLWKDFNLPGENQLLWWWQWAAVSAGLLLNASRADATQQIAAVEVDQLLLAVSAARSGVWFQTAVWSSAGQEPGVGGKKHLDGSWPVKWSWIFDLGWHEEVWSEVTCCWGDDHVISLSDNTPPEFFPPPTPFWNVSLLSEISTHARFWDLIPVLIWRL